MEAVKKFLKDWRGKVWFLINMFCTIIYLLWRFFFTIPFEYGLVSTIAGVALLVVEVLGMVEAFIHYANMYNVSHYELPKVPRELYPDVDVFIATYNEPPELLYKTVLGCTRMEYPDQSRVHIYLCDDNRRDTMRELAAKLGVNYLCRPDNKGAKAGNLNNALAHSSSPLVVTFDADMIPKRDFLMKTIPYFVDAEMKNQGKAEKEQIHLGFIQTPQSFYDLDLFQFNFYSENRIPNEQDYFYRDIQVARTKTNSVIYGGSNTVISRKALESIGGFYTGSVTEDFATGILIEKKGFVSLGLGEPLASGMSASNLRDLIQQRVRWARGVIQTGRKMHIYTSSDLTFAQKMNYWASIWYWYAPLKRLIYIMSPIMYAVFGFQVLKCTLTTILMFWLPMYITSNLSLRMLSRNIRSTKWTSLYETVLFPFMLLPVLLETVGLQIKKFKVTQKSGLQNEKGQNVLYMIPFLLLIVLSVIGIVNCVVIMFDSGSFGSIVVLFWLVYNLFLLIMALFFVDGRIPFRSSERVRAQIPCTIHLDGCSHSGITRDISETGASVLLEEPHYCPDAKESLVRLEFPDEIYPVTLTARLVYVGGMGHTPKSGQKRKKDKRWVYAFQFTDYNGCYDQLLGLLYDRETTMPNRIRLDSGVFEDLSINLKRRTMPPYSEKRAYARIEKNETVPCPEAPGGKIKVLDINYVCVTLEDKNLPEAVTLQIAGLELECRYDRTLENGRRLYLITNTPELMKNAGNEQALCQWMLRENPDAEQAGAGKQKNKDFDEIDEVMAAK